MTDAQPVDPIVRGLVLSAIDTCPDARLRARRIATALASGIITPAEAEARKARPA